ncbi:MAG TPA: hypothetical protein VHE37_13110 [Nevskiaceae bacterium]|nr:hypothetical protein [Nevskiaceae bacterium]
MRTPRSIALHLLLVAALLLRALIPAGLMPGSGGGAPALVICTADGARFSLAHDGHHPAQQAHCPFQLALGMAGVAVAALALPLLRATELPAASPQGAAFPNPVHHFYARGPPARSWLSF